MQDGVGVQLEEYSVRNSGRPECEAKGCSRAERTRPSIGLQEARDLPDLAEIEPPGTKNLGEGHSSGQRVRAPGWRPRHALENRFLCRDESRCLWERHRQ